MLDIFTGMRREDLKLPITAYLTVKDIGVLGRCLQRKRETKGGRRKGRNFYLITRHNVENTATLCRENDDKIFSLLEVLMLDQYEIKHC